MNETSEKPKDWVHISIRWAWGLWYWSVITPEPMFNTWGLGFSRARAVRKAATVVAAYNGYQGWTEIPT